jgi:hypothetical protein
MKLKSIAKNQTEVQFISGNYEITVFFSYETPVAVYIFHPVSSYIIKTDEKYSATTTKHINQFISRYPTNRIKTHAQKTINNILKHYYIQNIIDK